MLLTYVTCLYQPLLFLKSSNLGAPLHAALVGGEWGPLQVEELQDEELQVWQLAHTLGPMQPEVRLTWAGLGFSTGF